jgi:hypothetical protein
MLSILPETTFVRFIKIGRIFLYKW